MALDSAVQVLRKARATISGDECVSYEGVALALRHAATDSARSLINALNALHRTLGTLALATWFQTSKRTHAEVLNLFDRAIAAEEAKAP